MVRVQIKGGVWKNTEDEILKAAISKYGMNQWARISSLLVRKTPKQCKARWYEWLDPAIKKTEWSKEEDEKLLHLAKLMPTQWRTIAPIVGRTATQCLERYQRLLDEAEEQDREAGAMAGPSKLGLTGVAGPEAAPSAEDVRRLRPGEIDPDPESKPARPDPIDMDEDEKEMLSEARARLANTQGKKAKRKARERALEEARRLALLQKRRELKAAGVVMRGPKAKKGEVDYNADIPFEKQPVKGFYDTAEESSKSYQAPIGQKMGHMERKRKPGEEDDAKKKDKGEKKKPDPFSENSEQVRKLKEAEQISKRRKLMLPEAQVGERELEEIVKLGQAGESARELVAGGESTEGLLGNYDALERAKMARTPNMAPEDDVVMREARNLRNLTASQTPLLGDANIPMEEALGNLGARPRSSAVQTPNPLLTPAHHGGRPGGGPGDTPMSSRGSLASATPRGVGGPAATPMRTPLRDNLGLYGDETSSVMDATPFDERRARLAAKSDLLAGLRNLPAPSNNFEFVLDEDDEEEDDDDDDYGGMISISEDTADRDARMAQEREENQRNALARRSQVVKMDLPRPPNVDASALLASLKLSDASPSQRLVLQEMVQLMKHDSIVHPIAGSKAVGGLRSDLPLLSDAALDAAREEVRAELAQSVGFPGAKEEVLKRLIGAKLQPDEDGEGGEEGQALDEALRRNQEAVAWHADRSIWVPRSQLSSSQYKLGQAALLELAKESMIEAAQSASKEEKRLSKLLGGYQARSKVLAEEIKTRAEQFSAANVELHSFERLHGGESIVAQERIHTLQEDVRSLERREEIGQYRYRELDERRRGLKESVERLREERDLREAEKINEAALAQADEEEEEEGGGGEEGHPQMGSSSPVPAVNGATAS